MSIQKTLKRWAGEIGYRLQPGKAEENRVVDIPQFHSLRPGDIAIDCGANHGIISRILGHNGGTVHAFEPNPDAFKILTERTSDMANVIRHSQAVLDRACRMKLHLHVNYHLNPDRFSSRSSLLGEKRNVDEKSGVEVEVIDLVDFILALDRPVKLLKLDIEGAEYDLLNGLIDRGAMGRIDSIFVETHAHSIPSLRPVDKVLRQRITALGLEGKIDLNWI